MRKFLGFLFLLALLPAASQTVFHDYIDGQIYLKLREPLPAPVMKQNSRKIDPSSLALLQKLNATYSITAVTRPYAAASDDRLLPQVLRVTFSNSQAIGRLLRELNGDRAVEYAEKVPLCRITATPNEGIPPHLAQINAANAWNVFNGNSNITVAVVDNAVMSSHVDLAPNTYTNPGEIPNNNIDDDANGYVDDVSGWDVCDWDNNPNPSNTAMSHGTHCAGIAAGRTDNGIGIASIGWNVKLIPVKCEYNNGGVSSVSSGFEGILYASKAKARVISCSWGSTGSSATEQSVVDYAWNRGSIIVASASNNGVTTPNYPGAYNNVYCVAAVDPNFVKSGYSNYGSWVDISAPGDNINSTVPYVGTPQYLPLSGTSMAAPMVAGLAALMLSKSPAMTRQNVLNCISSTAVNIYTISGNNLYVGQLGAGCIEAYQAMLCASTFSALPPIANFYGLPQKACPGTNVQFTDSSLYAPTNWNWVFQGGSPPTSTATNPVVQWSTPGTYSVQLTVSNATGTNSITKLGYVTVAGPQPLPFAEGFQANTFLPLDWSPVNLWNDNLYWERFTGVGGFGTSTACARFDNFTYNVAGERDEMRSPKFDFSNVGTARLRFDVAYARYNAAFSDSLEVKISTNCGNSWTSIYLKGGTQLATAPDAASQFQPNAIQWRRDTVDISGLTAGQGNVMFSFINRGHYGQPIYLDNINLFFPQPTFSGLSNATVCVSSPFSFSFTPQFASSHTVSAPGANPASSTSSNVLLSYSAPGTYSVLVAATNGTSNAAVVRFITVLPYPTVSATGGTFCAGQMASLTASGANTYTWFNGSTGSNILYQAFTNTLLTVTGANGPCASNASLAISVTPGIPLSISTGTNQFCRGTAMTLTASGASSYAWTNGFGGAAISFTPVSTGTIGVTGYSSNCSAFAVTAYTVFQPPVTTTAMTQLSCAGICSGGHTLTSISGSAPFSFSGGACNGPNCAGVCPGTYTVVTTDINNCQTSDVFTFISPPAITATLSASNPTCGSCGNGSIGVTAGGGTPPYTYSWSPGGESSNEIIELKNGCYTVTIFDAQLCSRQETVCISNTTGLDALSFSQVRIFPNPATSELLIENLSAPAIIKVLNALGQVVHAEEITSASTRLDTRELARGLYLLEINVAGQPASFKLVLE